MELETSLQVELGGGCLNIHYCASVDPLARDSTVFDASTDYAFGFPPASTVVNIYFPENLDQGRIEAINTFLSEIYQKFDVTKKYNPILINDPTKDFNIFKHSDYFSIGISRNNKSYPNFISCGMNVRCSYDISNILAPLIVATSRHQGVELNVIDQYLKLIYSNSEEHLLETLSQKNEYSEDQIQKIISTFRYYKEKRDANNGNESRAIANDIANLREFSP